MQEQEYTKMADVEDSMWWYRSLHSVVLWALTRFVSCDDPAVLDVGCGTGGFLRYLQRHKQEYSGHGIDRSIEAARISGERFQQPGCCATAVRLPFAGARFQAITSSFLLDQKTVDPVVASKEAYRCLVPGGVYVVCLSAHDWLRSYHDEQVGVGRRFTRREIVGVLEESGFTIRYCTYWNLILLPLVVLRRKVLPPKRGASDVMSYSRIVDGLFGAFLGLENRLIRYGFSLPFGVSIIIVGEK